MKKTTAITSIDSRINYHEQMLVDFVNRNLADHVGLDENEFSGDYTSLNWASTDIPVAGSLDMVYTGTDCLERISLPVQSYFFITCTKDKSGYCRVGWSSSLS